MPQEKKWVKPRPNADAIRSSSPEPFSYMPGSDREITIDVRGARAARELNEQRASDRKSRGIDYSIFPPQKMEPKMYEKIRNARQSAQDNEWQNRGSKNTNADYNRAAYAKESVSPQRRIAQPQKPITAAQAALAMSSKKATSNGTFKNGNPRSAMSAGLKIK